ncbi:hypothetical protein AmaxDRAFT_0235 [Limnospira maxima CS-328]|uniref:Uncharacterized protein n=1 Tax=Limnospira maxima CS-328 TaxID=513049 RepID=B5VUJ0_LIMMA|nr:hypothetical protein [Limnospira maxima]EDZ97206.1 hypothetical protein AmaxDRAFT_0235 [Limnospira maxima CS-328]
MYKPTRRQAFPGFVERAIALMIGECLNIFYQVAAGSYILPPGVFDVEVLPMCLRWWQYQNYQQSLKHIRLITFTTKPT